MSLAPDAANHRAPRVPGYELVRVLGEGAAGVVYEAHAEGERDNHLAIKVLHPYLATDEQVRGRFLREAQILAQLSGPSVCPVLAVGETDDGLPYMVMPKIEGRKLSEVDKSRLSAKDAVRLVCDICSALEVAHRAGIVHRDLKPDNVLISRDRVIVVDFGMAKILRGSQEGQSAELTTTGMIFGTPEYMAPEQARGETADPRCDVYAAGIILYELLSGSVPLIAANAILTLVKVSRESAPPLHERTKRADLSEALEACVMHAIANDRDQRYSSARAFRDALMVAIHHPERAAVVRPDHYFDTEGEAGLTMQVTPHLAQRSPAPSTARSMEAPALDEDDEDDDDDFSDQEHTLAAPVSIAAPKSRRARGGDIETLPDLSRERDALKLPPESRMPPRAHRPPPRSEPMSSRTRAAPLSQPRVSRPPASSPSLSRPSYVAPPPPVSSHTGHTPSYVSKPAALPARAPIDSKRLALAVWAVLAILAVLAGVALALRGAG